MRSRTARRRRRPLVILLSGLTTFGVLLFWEWRNPCPCSSGVVGSPDLPSVPVPPTQVMFPYLTLEGETLEDVARKFGVPVPTLQALNNLPPDHPLPPGQLVFVPGTPPALEAGAPQVRRWSVVDEEGNTFLFPPVVLYAQGSLFLWTKPGVNTAVDVYWGLDTAVWERGETVVLRNARGEEVHRFEIP